MDIATTMAAVNYFNMVNTWNMLAMQDTELFTVTEKWEGRRNDEWFNFRYLYRKRLCGKFI